MTIMKILSHPLMQVFSFSIILVGSPYFGGPYGFFIYHASLEGYLYGIIGAVAILVTLVAAFYSNKNIQLAGLGLMIISLLVFFIGGKFINASTLHEFLPLITLLLFLAITVIVIATRIRIT